MRKNIYATLILAFCFLAPQKILANPLSLTYDLKLTVTTEDKDGKKQNKETISTLTVILEDSYLVVEAGDAKSVFDFKKNQIVYMNAAEKSYSEVSLFSDIGFRYMEFQNRFFIQDVLRSAIEKDGKVKLAKQEDNFDIETIFGITKPGSPEPSVIENKRQDLYEYIFNNQTYVEFRPSEEILDETQIPLFEKFLIYYCHLHPKIRKSIISKKRIPGYLKYITIEDWKTTCSELTLVKTDFEQSDPSVIPAGYRKIYSTSSQELSDIIDSVVSGKSTIKRIEKTDIIKISDELKSSKNYFDAVLVIVEYGLQTGEDMSWQLKEVMSAGGKDDPRTQQFFSNLGAKDKDSAEKAGRALESINRDGLTHGYVIDIMIGDDKMSLGDFENAKRLFLSVLKINPYIAGVYKDLGDIFNTSYDMTSAWQCWDTARLLYPQHKMLQKINEYEKWLMDTFPDFFLHQEP